MRAASSPSPLPAYTDSNLEPHERRANLSHIETSFLVSALLGYAWFHVILLQLDKSLLCNMVRSGLDNRNNKKDKWINGSLDLQKGLILVSSLKENVGQASAKA